MTLPLPSKRELIHDRNIHCKGYVRADGMFDIEAELVDFKTYDFPSDTHGIVSANTPYHHMQVRLTVDITLMVIDACAITLAGPFRICPDAAKNIVNLIGLQIGPGWRRKVHNAIGGAAGCTHITELTGPIATTAYQTIGGEISRRKRAGAASDELPDINQKDTLKNTCLAFADTS